MEIVIIEKTAFDMLLAGVKALEGQGEDACRKGRRPPPCRMDGHGGRVPYAEHNPEDLAGHARQARHCIFPNRDASSITGRRMWNGCCPFPKRDNRPSDT